MLRIPEKPRRPDEVRKLLPLTRSFNGKPVLIDGKPIQVFVPPELYPPVLGMMPFVGEPKILSGEVATGQIKCGLAANIFEDDMRERLRQIPGGPFLLSMPWKARDFLRLLVKIAHGFAIAERGLDSFNPLLLDMIQGNFDKPDLLIGGERETREPSDSLHDLSLEERIVGVRSYLVAHVRLFASFRGPTYHVVVGELNSPNEHKN
jgi:hypothetical protein